MVKSQKHKMKLEIVHPSGAEEWACSECGRRFVAQWFPQFRRVILIQGNENIIHAGQGMNAQMHISLGINENNVKLQDVWKQWFEKMGLDLENDDDSND